MDDRTKAIEKLWRDSDVMAKWPDIAKAYDAGMAAERARMDRLYKVVSRIVEQDHVVNLTRLHDYCFGEPGVSADAVDGGPAED